jgi:molybdate transport system ATP-binding protein
MSAEHLSLRLRLGFPGFELDLEEELELAGVTAVFGPSGSGKSTLLRAIAGFEKPTAGRIAWGDRVWFDADAGIFLPPDRRPVGFMFQDARLFAHLDVAGNLAYAEHARRRRRRRHGPPQAPLPHQAVVAALDLEPLLHRQVGSLSGGERQRVALGRTLLANPSLLLLDEPLAALDRERKAGILPYLEAVPRQFRIPTLYVSHDVDEVARLADRVVVLARGRVTLQGGAADVLESLDLEPITGRFEAGVLLEGRVLAHDPRWHLTSVDVGGDRFTLPMIERVPVGERVRLRVRSRDVALATRRPEGLSIRNVLPGTVLALVPATDAAAVEAYVQLRGARLRARLTRAAVAELALVEGMPVFALVKSVSFVPA